MDDGVPPEFLEIDFSSESDEGQPPAPGQNSSAAALGVNGLVPDDSAPLRAGLAEERVLRPAMEAPLPSARHVPIEMLSPLGTIHHYLDGRAMFSGARAPGLFGFVVGQPDGVGEAAGQAEQTSEEMDDAEIIVPGASVFDSDGTELGVIFDVLGKVSAPMYLCAQPTAACVEAASATETPFLLSDFPSATELSPLLTNSIAHPPGTPTFILRTSRRYPVATLAQERPGSSSSSYSEESEDD